MLLVAVIFAAAAANLAGQWPGRGSRTESLLGSLGFLNENRLAERAYRKLWTGTLEAQTAAVKETERALVSDMASAYRWCDLAEALLEGSPEDKVKYCLRQAVELGPLAPQILMRAVNGYFRLADTEDALSCARRILAIVPVYDQIIFSTYVRMGVTVDQALAQGLPEGDPRPARAFLEYLLSHNSIDEARKVWVWAGRHQALNDDVADRYAAALLQARRYELAVDSWTSYLGSRAGRDGGNCLFNGSFEHDPYGRTFDWTIQPMPGVRVERDPKVAYAGHAALRIHFDGNENISYSHVRQTVFAPPGVYRIEARLRTEGITTDQGVALRVHDAEYSARSRGQTAAVVGTTDWVTIWRDITIAPPTRLLSVEIIRDPSDRFDSAIGGTAWIDDVRIIRR
jgi:tetratricopeptide (TPR) repeat protein